MILSWRNSPEIRKWMYSQDEISLNHHLDFIESLRIRKDKEYFLVVKDEEYIGVVDFTDIKYKESVTMGLYTNPNLKGQGRILLEIIINYSFKILHVKSVLSEVFYENKKAYDLYKRYNFKDKGEKIINNKKVIFMELEDENR
ncbi:UDP-4-amino-4,6-dideoxy-N-acetyl-beta-L-altrosamine N-acetyltransferase [Arcobacter porcinus]|nr:UDP-4-amino-4,6-dideoxy-N-acetyl-beta-L-altrosamine N-acetyltransferase [Arcobacter porcinus]